MKEAASRTSPTISVICEASTSMESRHRPFSEYRAETRRWASVSFSAQRLASAMAVFFSTVARSNFSTSTARSASSWATSRLTLASFSLAVSSLALASSRAERLGIIWVMAS